MKKIIYENGNRKNSIKAYYLQPTSLKDELIKIRGRLINEAGTYIEAILNHNKTHNYEVGFFGSVRVIVPIIDHLTFIIYRDRSRKSRNKLLKDLGIKYPELVWHIFRHSLIHGDVPCQITMGKQVITWFIKLHNTEHEYEILNGNFKSSTNRPLETPIVIHLDIIKLYNDLVNYLETLSNNTSKSKKTYLIIDTVLMKTKSKKVKKGNKIMRNTKKVNKEVLEEIKLIKG